MSPSQAKRARVQEITRRHFLGKATAIALSTTGWSELAPDVAGLGDKAASQDDLFVINMLGGIVNLNPRPGGGAIGLFDPRSIADAIDSGMRAVNVTVGGFAWDTEESFEFTVTEVTRWAQTVRSRSDTLLTVLNASDIERAEEERKVGVIFGFQNAVMVGDDVSRVTTFADLGVRVVQLTYNGANQLGHGALVPENGELTPFGHEVIEALEGAEVLVDLSHSSERTCIDALRTATRPTAITHTGCRALANLPNNKTDEELRLVAETGGIVGIYFMPFFLVRDGMATAEDVVDHVEHAINVCGEDHVGIGTDAGTTKIDDMEAFLASTLHSRARQLLQERGGVVLGPGDLPLIPELHGPDQFRRVARILMDRGHSAERVEKIMGRNALRVMREVWRG